MLGYAFEPKVIKVSYLCMSIQQPYSNSDSIAHSLLHNIREALEEWGLSGAIDGRYDKWIYLIVFTIAALITIYILRHITSAILHNISTQLRNTFIREILNTQLIKTLLWLLLPMSLLIMLPFAFRESPLAYEWIHRLCSIAIVIIVVQTINIAATIAWNLFSKRESMRNRPMRGLIQIVHGIFIGLGVITIISILINRSPIALITGLGAFAAVLMLVFKDTILGFVAGMQLTQNDIIRNGDWITLPGTPINGIVEDVSLNTVKIRNYDNTIMTIPPYSLVSQVMQNWRGMKTAGVRRIMRGYLIDLNSVKFCTNELLNKLSNISILHDFIEKKRSQSAHGIASNTHNPTGLVDGTIETNLGLFRAYLALYLRQHSDVESDRYMFMARTLEPTENGIPLQIYCFSNTIHWESYESIQSEIMEHIAAIMPKFELYPFQNASGRDYIVQSLLAAGYSPQSLSNIPYDIIEQIEEDNLTQHPNGSSQSTIVQPPTPKQ